MRAQGPLVSVIIPCYNAEAYVGDAIQSALQQDYRHIEVVVVDDGSSDRSREVVSGFGSRVRLVEADHMGACAARNLGIEAARGDLIQFLDADDLLNRNKLSTQVPHVISASDAIVYSSYFIVDWSGRPIPGLSAPKDRCDDPVVFALKTVGLQTSAPIHWRSALLAIHGFREELPCAQERDLHLRLACHGWAFRHLRKELFVVRRRESSLSSNYFRIVDQYPSIAWTAYQILSGQGDLRPARRRALAHFIAKGGRYYRLQGQPDRAEQFFEEARQMCPGIPHSELISGPPGSWIRRTVTEVRRISGRLARTS